MVKALFDTNILIDYLNGVKQSSHTFERFEDKAISIITWMEVMVGTNPTNKKQTELFLSSFEIISISKNIAAKAVELRQTKRIKLPDAIIWSSAISEDRVLVTRNTKNFENTEIGVHIPYNL